MRINWLIRRKEVRVLREQLHDVEERERALAGQFFNAQLNVELGLEQARLRRLLKEVLNG